MVLGLQGWDDIKGKTNRTQGGTVTGEGRVGGAQNCVECFG